MSERDVFSNEQRAALDAILRARETALRLTLDRHDRDLARIEHVLFGDPQRGVLGFAARLERIEAAINALQDQYAALINQARGVRHALIIVAALLTLFNAPQALNYALRLLGGMP